MEILLIGLNHNSAPVELRERLHFDQARLEEPLKALCANPEIEEAVILSTCNRVDVIVRVEGSEGGAERLKEFLASSRGVPIGEFEPYLYRMGGEEAVPQGVAAGAGFPRWGCRAGGLSGILTVGDDLLL